MKIAVSLGLGIWVIWIMIMIIEIDTRGRGAYYGVMCDGLLFEIPGEESKPDGLRITAKLWSYFRSCNNATSSIFSLFFPSNPQCLTYWFKASVFLFFPYPQQILPLVHWKENIPTMIKFTSKTTNSVIFSHKSQFFFIFLYTVDKLFLFLSKVRFISYPLLASQELQPLTIHLSLALSTCFITYLESLVLRQ